MNQTTGHSEALSQLLQGTRLRPDEVGKLLAQALDPAYWEELDASLRVNGREDPASLELINIEPDQQARSAEKFAREGYFEFDGLLSATAVARLRNSIEVVKKAGWPAVFAFVYDEFWLASRAPSLVKFLSALLGPDYQQNCHVWSHYVNPQRGAAGWPPHVDNPNRPQRVSVWIALNDATLDNGCMYLVPKGLVPQRIIDTFTKLETFSREDLDLLLQNSRALPVRAGAVLGWDSEVIHWGSCHHSAEGDPRISTSQEFLSVSMNPRKDELPLLPGCGSLPTFRQRLYMIGTGILTYQRIETRLIRFLELAQRLVDATASEGPSDQPIRK